MINKILETFFVKVEVKGKKRDLILRRSNGSCHYVDLQTKIPDETTVLSGYFSHIKGLAVTRISDRLYARNRL